jgi:hypothetical protein
MHSFQSGYWLSYGLIAFSAFTATSNAQTSSAAMTRTPVVIELFTSEGCSSCPPADALLQKLQSQQPVAGAEIIALEEHVDYWNHDGWVDPYSSPDWTRRQVDYGSVFKNDPYTPQAVVDGHSQFLGSNVGDAQRVIEGAAHEAKADVMITSKDPDAKDLRHFSVSVGKLPANATGDVAEIWLAVTEDGLHSSVSKGENSGRVLTHIATLRSLRKIGIAHATATPVSFTGDTAVKFDPRWNPDNVRITVFVQKKKSREILGAASTKIKS